MMAESSRDEGFELYDAGWEAGREYGREEHEKLREALAELHAAFAEAKPKTQGRRHKAMTKAAAVLAETQGR